MLNELFECYFCLLIHEAKVVKDDEKGPILVVHASEETYDLLHVIVLLRDDPKLLEDQIHYLKE